MRYVRSLTVDDLFRHLHGKPKHRFGYLEAGGDKWRLCSCFSGEEYAPFKAGIAMQVESLERARNASALRGSVVRAMLLYHNEVGTLRELRSFPPCLGIAAWKRQHLIRWPSFTTR